MENDREINDYETETERYCCGDCVYWKFENAKYCPCKRIDHDTIKFAIPWFATYDANQRTGIICRDFCPKHAVENWEGFDKYWDGYVRDWLPYGNIDTTVSFCLNNDSSVRYKVRLMDFVNGTMFDGDTLKAVEKTYYKQSRKSPFGYELVHEKIDGVKIPLDIGTNKE